MNVTRIAGLLVLAAASFALSACGGGGAPTTATAATAPTSTADCLYRSGAGDGRRAGLRDQLLEQRARAESLRPVPQRHQPGADAELCAQRRCEPGVRAGQHRGQSGAALDFAHRHQGERRTQLLARRPDGLRPDLDHLDQQLGRRHRRDLGHAGAAAGAADSERRAELEFPG